MKKRNNKKKKKYILIIVLILIILTSLIISRFSKKKEYTTLEDFTEIKEVIEYLNCKYIKEKRSDDKNYDIDVYVNFVVNLYDENGESQENFYSRLISMISTVSKYKDVRIIDEEKNITIEIQGNQENGEIETYLINGIEYYFFKEDSKRNSNITEEEEININIKATKIRQAIEESWDIRKVDFGSKESEFEGYEIYFNEGIEVKKLNNKIFNIVFNMNYKDEVVEGIKVGTTVEEIKEKLGQPHFVSENEIIIGYKTKDIYIFFEEDEISVYRVDNRKRNELEIIINNYVEDRDFKKLTNEIIEKWDDYDIYIANEEKFELTYTLKGLKIEVSGSDSDGIHLYTNFNSGNLDKEKVIDTGDVYYEKTNLVYESESSRYFKKQNMQYLYDDYINHFDKDSKRSSQYSFMITKEENSGINRISFLSKSLEYPSRTLEISDEINKSMWFDDFDFIYSIKNKGMYLYNLANGKTYTITEGEKEFNIEKVEDSKIYYDNEVIEIKNN